jgi:hypothetical protein
MLLNHYYLKHVFYKNYILTQYKKTFLKLINLGYEKTFYNYLYLIDSCNDFLF